LTDPKLALKGLLEAEWDGDGVGLVPKFSSDWYDAKEQMPQVVVSHVLTQPRIVGFSSNLPTAQRRFEATYAVDVWSKGDQEKRWAILEEVDRIIHSKCNSPGGGLEFAEASNWRDLDEGDMHPRLYRSRVHVEVLYYG
jgi:hypothetical protein